MGINFSAARWDKVVRDYEAFWDGRLARPMIQAYLWGRDPGRQRPDKPWLGQHNCHDFSISADDIIDMYDYHLSCVDFFADAFPAMNLTSFGPGIVAAMLGAKLENRTGGAWFFPEKYVPIEELHLEFDPDNKCLNRLREMYRAAYRRWGGQVCVEMTDLGGTLDVLSSFFKGEGLLYELYDKPDEVKRLTWEIHDAWFKIYHELIKEMGENAQGFSNWGGVFSRRTSYILQCDFAYMIGPEMFREFVLPELEMMTRKISRTIYHLDGIGQLAHLDILLDIPTLHGIQWVPGDGKKPHHEWMDLFKTILSKNKKILFYGGINEYRKLKEQAGSLKNVLTFYSANYKDMSANDLMRTLDEFLVV